MEEGRNAEREKEGALRDGGKSREGGKGERKRQREILLFKY